MRIDQSAKTDLVFKQTLYNRQPLVKLKNLKKLFEYRAISRHFGPRMGPRFREKLILKFKN